MNIYSAMIAMQATRLVLKNEQGDTFQRENDNVIYVTYNQERRLNTGSVSSPLKNMEFLKKHIDDEFTIVIQWHSKCRFPVLCKVKERGSSKSEIVCFVSRSGDMMHTGIGLSHRLRHSKDIQPLSMEECQAMIHEDETQEEACTYPVCKCPFDMGTDGECFKGLKR